MTTQTTAPVFVDTLGCDYCGKDIADDPGMGEVTFTTTACVASIGTFCEECAVTPDGWPLEGIWCEPGDTLDYSEL